MKLAFISFKDIFHSLGIFIKCPTFWLCITSKPGLFCNLY